MSIIIYDANIRAKVVDENIDNWSNIHNGIFEKFSRGVYKNKIGSFLYDVNLLVGRLAPEGLDNQLAFMKSYRQPRPYEKQLQTALNNLYNGEPSTEVRMLLQLVMKNLNGVYDKGYVGVDDLSRITEVKYRKHEIASIYNSLGMGGVILVLRYYIDFWYQI